MANMRNHMWEEECKKVQMFIECIYILILNDFLSWNYYTIARVLEYQSVCVRAYKYGTLSDLLFVCLVKLL